MIGTRGARVVWLAMLAASAASCATGTETSTEPAGVQTATADPSPAAEATPPQGPTEAISSAVPVNETLATFTEAEVIDIASVASADAVERARFAQLRAENPDVKVFATKLLADHRNLLSRLGALHPPTTAPDPTAALLQREEQLVALDLHTQPDAAAFELAYMTTQIGTIAKMIALLDRSLLPSVADARTTRATMLVVRAMYVGHLVKALDLQQRVLRSALSAGTTDTAGGGGGNPGSSLTITPHK